MACGLGHSVGQIKNKTDLSCNQIYYVKKYEIMSRNNECGHITKILDLRREKW